MIWIINDSLELHIIKTGLYNLLSFTNYNTNLNYSCQLNVDCLDIHLLEKSITNSISNNTLVMYISNENTLLNIPISLYIQKELTIQFNLLNHNYHSIRNNDTQDHNHDSSHHPIDLGYTTHTNTDTPQRSELQGIIQIPVPYEKTKASDKKRKSYTKKIKKDANKYKKLDDPVESKDKLKKCRECQIKKLTTEFNRSKRYLYKAICKGCEEMFSV